jgi:hypothetical protein
MSGLLVNTGPMFDYTYLGNVATAAAVKNDVYVGPGNYTTLLGAAYYTNLTIEPEADGTFIIESAGFGVVSAS